MRRLIQILILVAGLNADAQSVTQTLIATNSAFWSNNFNTISIAANHIQTRSNIQYAVWCNTNLDFIWTTRDLSSGALTNYGPFSVMTSPDADEHRIGAFEFDKVGRCHFLFGMHSATVFYQTNTSAWRVDGWSAQLWGGYWTNKIRGHDLGGTYPMFSKNPYDNELYSTIRDGASGNGDQIFLHWNTTTGLWELPSGMTTNMVINGVDDTVSAYLQGPPLWDSNTNLWFTFSIWNGSVYTNQYAIYWTGSAWKNFNGASLTMPVKYGTLAPAVNTSAQAGLTSMGQQIFCIQSNVVYVPYIRTNTGNLPQLYVAENSGGTFTEHVLTAFTNQPICRLYATASANTNGPVYIFVQNVWNPTNQFLAYASSDRFSTFTTNIIATRYAPNFVATFDPARLRDGVFSQQFMYSDDYQYGLVFVTNTISAAERGKLWIEDITFPSIPTSVVNLYANTLFTQ